MRQKNPSKGKSDFSEKRSKSTGYSREGKPAFKKEGSKSRENFSFSDKPKRAYDSDKKRPYKKDAGGYDKSEHSYGDKPKRSYGSSEKPAYKKTGGYDKPERSYSDKPKRSYDSGEKPAYKKSGSYDKSERSYSDKPKRSYDSGEKPAYKKSGGYGKPEKPFTGKPKHSYSSDSNRPFFRKDDHTERSHTARPKRHHADDEQYDAFKKEKDKPSRSKRTFDEGSAKAYSGGAKHAAYDRKDDHDEQPALNYKEKKHLESYEKLNKKKKTTSSDDTIRLNRYIANAGICSRREADVLIASGVVTVNGKVVTEMGHKVTMDDVVTYDGAAIKNEEKKYLLLNKPKDYITTMDDPQERRTVMELIKSACRERLYPVGRLDRNTTGLLLFTNDGDMAAKLTHPKHNIKKVYHVTLNKKITADDFKKISEGIELEDGFIRPDAIEYVEEGKKDLGIEIHSGRNRIVRRIFEQLGYEVVRLDRVTFAGLTKKDIPRGKWRFLSTKEVNFLKMLK